MLLYTQYVCAVTYLKIETGDEKDDGYVWFLYGKDF